MVIEGNPWVNKLNYDKNPQNDGLSLVIYSSDHFSSAINGFEVIFKAQQPSISELYKPLNF